MGKWGDAIACMSFSYLWLLSSRFGVVLGLLNKPSASLPRWIDVSPYSLLPTPHSPIHSSPRYRNPGQFQNRIGIPGVVGIVGAVCGQRESGGTGVELAGEDEATLEGGGVLNIYVDIIAGGNQVVEVSHVIFEDHHRSHLRSHVVERNRLARTIGHF